MGKQLSIAGVVPFLVNSLLERGGSFSGLLHVLLWYFIILFDRRGQDLYLFGEDVLLIDFLQSVVAVGSEILLQLVFEFLD